MNTILNEVTAPPLSRPLPSCRYAKAMAFPLFMMTAMGAKDVGDDVDKRGTGQVGRGPGSVWVCSVFFGGGGDKGIKSS